MSRDDRVLYTGISSSSFASHKELEVKSKQQDAKEKRLELSQSVKSPIAKTIVEALDAERDKTISTLLAIVGPSSPNEDVKSLIISLNLYKDSMDRIKSKLVVLLKTT